MGKNPFKNGRHLNQTLLMKRLLMAICLTTDNEFYHGNSSGSAGCFSIVPDERHD